MRPARTPEEIDARVDAWHHGAGDGVELHEFLGWTWEEYGDWVRTLRIPQPPEDVPDHWQTLGVCLAVVLIMLVIIYMNLDGA